jgi:ketosteroid isomerase-like protein
MKIKFILLAASLLLICFACTPKVQTQNSTDRSYKPVSQALYDTIMHMDSMLFNAFNAHDPEKMGKIFSEDLEFFHDKDGLNRYEKTMESFRNVLQGIPDINRHYIPGTIEVYPAGDYGAIQTGQHRFCHNETGKPDCGTFKFMHIWKRTAEGWKLSRVVSYAH